MIYDNMCELQVREVRVNLQANVGLVRVILYASFEYDFVIKNV